MTRPAVLPSLLVMVAVSLALLPLTVLAKAQWAVPTALAFILLVTLTGIVSRAIFPRGGMSAVLQLVVLIFALVVLEVALGANPELTLNPLTWLDAHIDVIRMSAQQLARSVPPVDASAQLIVMLAFVVGLLTLLLDILFADLQWHTPAALTVLCLGLVPAIHVAGSIPLALYAGPIAGAILLFTGPTLARAPLAVTGFSAFALAGAVGLAPVIAPTMALGIAPAYPVSLASIQRPGGGLDGVMISDTVSVRRTLNEKVERKVATYHTRDDKPVYLRSRVLTTFSGETFRAPNESVRAEAFTAPPSPTDSSLQRRNRLFRDPDNAPFSVTINQLTADRIPVPSGLRAFAGSPSFDPYVQPPDLGEVVVVGGPRVLDGQEYYFDAEVPEPDPQALAAVTSEQLRESDPGLKIDAPAPGYVVDLAEQLREDAGATTPLETALAYQNYFWTFDYSLTTTTPAGADPLRSFLDDRIGYCEQFAATFALMMNSQGFPTRVVIGFTGGERVGEGTYEVTNRDAHAWPETWFGPELGWVRFEPTPSSAGPGVRPPITSLTDAGDSPLAPTIAPTAPPTQADQATPETPEPSASSTASASASATSGTEASGVGSATGSTPLLAVATALLIGLVGAAALVVAVLVLSGTVRTADGFGARARAAGRMQRWASAHGVAAFTGSLEPAARTAYGEIVRAAREAGMQVRPRSEPAEVLEEIAVQYPQVAEDARALKDAVTRGLYAPAAPTGDDGRSGENSDGWESDGVGRGGDSHEIRTRAEKVTRALRNASGEQPGE